MAFLTSLVISPLTWIIWLSMGAITTIITGTVARLEYKKRRLDSTIFVSNNLRITSAISIGCGLITAILLCLEILPGSCMLQLVASLIVGGNQFVFIGLYQLSRLHYCFSKTSAHHQNGYPKWLFLVMVIIGVALQVSCTVLFTFGQPLPSTCGFKKDFRFEFEYKDSSILFEGNLDEQMTHFYSYYMIYVATFRSWDISILLLYCYKIKSFRKTRALRRDAVWRKIIFILQRIIIVTLFYQISSVTLGFARYNVQKYLQKLTIAKYSLYHAVIALSTILYSISMYLMMEHNTDEYLRFLRCLKKSYLKYICFCCCHRMVDRQLTEFEQMGFNKKLEVTQLCRRRSITSTMFPNISQNVKYSRKRPMTLSIPTATQEPED